MQPFCNKLEIRTFAFVNILEHRRSPVMSGDANIPVGILVSLDPFPSTVEEIVQLIRKWSEDYENPNEEFLRARRKILPA